MNEEEQQDTVEQGRPVYLDADEGVLDEAGFEQQTAEYALAQAADDYDEIVVIDHVEALMSSADMGLMDASQSLQ